MLKRLRLALLVLAVPALAQTQTQVPEKAPGEVYKLAGPSVVLIETYGPDGKLSKLAGRN
ncbi:MAG: hypothetical protein WB607_13905 [Candidatus Acidiferrum sp.]|jgi:hypothetical protein